MMLLGPDALPIWIIKRQELVVPGAGTSGVGLNFTLA